jgi:hypothetical protein
MVSHGCRLLFPEAVHPAGRRPAQIDRRRAEAAHRARPGDEGPEDLEEPVGRLLHGIGKPGHQQRIDHRRRGRHPQRLAVEPRAHATLRGEQFLPVGVEHRRHFGAAINLERQRGTENRHAVRVVGGAIERVEHPAMTLAGTGATQFLGQHIVVRKRSATSARNIRSTSRSTSVTMSMAPFLSMRTPVRNLDRWISPARATASTAVARNAGL